MAISRFLVVWLLLAGTATPAAGQDVSVESTIIGTQAVTDIWKDDNGLIYAIPQAEAEIMLRYDGARLTRLGRKDIQGEGLELPQGYTHDLTLQLAGNRVLTVSNATQQILTLDLSTLDFQIMNFSDVGLTGRLLSVDTVPSGTAFSAVAAWNDTIRYAEWSKDGLDFSVPLFKDKPILDTKQVPIGHDTVLIDVYTKGALFLNRRTREVTLLDYSVLDRLPVITTGKRKQLYFSELRWQPDGHLYAACLFQTNGLYVFDRAAVRFNRIDPPLAVASETLTSIPLMDSLGNSLFVSGNRNGKRRSVLLDANGNAYDLGNTIGEIKIGGRNHDFYNSYVSDDLGKGFWAASESTGIIKIEFSQERVKHYWKGFGFRKPRRIHPDTMIISSFRHGIFRMSRVEGKFELDHKHVWYKNRGSVIVGGQNTATDSNGTLWCNDEEKMFGFDVATDSAVEVPLPGKMGQSWALLNDSTALVSLHDGRLILLQLPSADYQGVDKIGLPEYEQILNMHLDRSGAIWLATDNGLFRGNPLLGEPWEPRLAELGEQTIVYDFNVSDDVNWWMATNKGWVNYAAKEDKVVRRYTTEDGLVNNNVRSAVLAEGHYWIGTRNGLSRFNPTTGEFKTFDSEQGFSSKKFTAGAAYLPGVNLIGFGTDNGFNYFEPDALLDDPAPTLIINSLAYFNQESDKLSRKLSVATDYSALSLPASNRSLEIEFFLDDPNKPDEHQYACRLRGEQEGWTYINNRSQLSLSGLAAGRHTLDIKGRTRFSAWSKPLTLNVHVASFFYSTWWFRLAALMLIAGLVGAWIYRLRKERASLKRKVEERTATIRKDKEVIEQQAQDLRELDVAKTRFFNNISHEFRTPLTVIRGFARETLRAGEPVGGEKARINLGLIESNSNRLLLLVNQILELSKLEAGKLTVNYQLADLRPELDLIMASFHAIAYEKKLRLKSSIAFTELAMHLDIDKFIKIVYNLLSNAVKFTPDGGAINLQARLGEAGSVVVSVHDTGIGVPSQKLESIFNRFSQVDDGNTRKQEGSGIGLNFARELAELLGGALTVESEVGVGSTFTLTLPRWREGAELVANGNGRNALQYFPTPAAIKPSAPSTRPQSAQDLPLVLVVEDNRDIVAYLELCLADNYQLISARNGQEGLRSALESIPDLVITDIMMPVMDGLELCGKLKTNERTSHVPVIMLTALSSVENRVKGLRKGADAYLSKPFSREEVTVQIRNLLEGRTRLWRHFDRIQNKTENLVLLSAATPEEADYAKTENAFLDRLRKIVEAQIERPDFRTEELARAATLSQSQLWRKIKAVTGMSTKEFVSDIRMERARALLKEGNLSIAQVAYSVGFVDPSYFSKRFAKRFGVSPTGFQKATEVEGA